MSNTEDKNEKPDMIPKPTATPSFDESTPVADVTLEDLSFISP